MMKMIAKPRRNKGGRPPGKKWDVIAHAVVQASLHPAAVDQAVELDVPTGRDAASYRREVLIRLSQPRRGLRCSSTVLSDRKIAVWLRDANETS